MKYLQQSAKLQPRTGDAKLLKLAVVSSRYACEASLCQAFPRLWCTLPLRHAKQR